MVVFHVAVQVFCAEGFVARFEPDINHITPAGFEGFDHFLIQHVKAQIAVERQMDFFNVHRHEFIEPVFVHIKNSIAELNELDERIFRQQELHELNGLFGTPEAGILIFVRIDIAELRVAAVGTAEQATPGEHDHRGKIL